MYNGLDDQEYEDESVYVPFKEKEWQQNSAILSQTEPDSYSVPPGVYQARRGDYIPGKTLFSQRSAHICRATTTQRATNADAQHGRRELKDLLQIYLTEIGITPLLNREQETELGKKAQTGDLQAKETLIKANLRLVVKIAKTFQNMGLPIMDLISEGNLGLMEAVDRFDPNKFENKFSTYAVWWIKRRMREALITKSRIIRLPFGIGRKMNKILDAQQELESELKRIPTEEEVAERAGISLFAVKSWMNFHSSNSLDAMAENGYDIASEQTSSGDALGNEEMIEKMFEMIVGLPERDQTILHLRFGLGGEDPLSLKQVGEKLGMTGESVRQIQNSAINKLKKLRKL